MGEDKDDFFDLVFEKMEDTDIFDMNDTLLEKYRKENIEVSDKLYEFIEKRVHPNCKKELLKMLNKRNDTTSNYYYRENQLYYQNGFMQGMYVVISMFNHIKGK